MTGKPRAAGDTAVRVGPAGKTPSLGTLEQLVLEAMQAAQAMIAAPGDAKPRTAYRRSLENVRTRVPALELVTIAADIVTFLAGSVTTGEHNLARCASRCAGRLASRHRFPRKETTQ